MAFAPISNYERWIQGAAPLPAGAVPLAEDGTGVVCLLPNGRWIMWSQGVIQSLPPETQKTVLDLVVRLLGGTAAGASRHLNISTRTVEAWRAAKAPLPIKSAYLIAQQLLQVDLPIIHS